MTDTDRVAERVLQEHMLVGPRTGQCSCGFGGPDRPFTARELGRPHARHVVEQLRAAGVLAARGPREWNRPGGSPSVAPTDAEFPRLVDLPLTEETVLGQVLLPVLASGGRVSVSRGSYSKSGHEIDGHVTDVAVTVRWDPADGGVLNLELEYR